MSDFSIPKGKLLKTKSMQSMALAIKALNDVLSTLDVTKKVDKSLVLYAAEAVVAAEQAVTEWLQEATKRAIEEVDVDTKEDEILAMEAKAKVAQLRKLCAKMATIVTMEVVMENRMTKSSQFLYWISSALIVTSIAVYCVR